MQADAIRFLEQSTFGPNDALLAHVQSIGTQEFLNEQFAAPASQYPAFSTFPRASRQRSVPPILTYSAHAIITRCSFFRMAFFSERTLRERPVAPARCVRAVADPGHLGHWTSTSPYGMAKYQQMFLDNAFGNYEDILTKVTLSSVMGDYLNMVNNDKPANGVEPNENYARRSCSCSRSGVWKLNQDGHADSRCQRARRFRPTTRAIRSRGSRTCSRAGPIRCCPASPTHAQSEEFPRRHGPGRLEPRQGREDLAQRSDAASGAIDPVGSQQRDPQRSSCTRTSVRSSASSSSRSW